MNEARRRARRIATCLGLVSAVAWSQSARAQTVGDVAAAQELFDRAKQLVAKKNYADACPQFAESQRLDPQPGTEFNLADCYEHVGKTASAWVAFDDTADRLRVKNDKTRASVAQSRAAALKPKLSRLTINPPRGARVDGLIIRRDEAAVRDPEWGVALPVDPGTHVVEASAPGMQTWKTTVDVEGESQSVSVDVPALSPLPVAVATAGPTPSAPPAAAPDVGTAPGSTPAAGKSAQRTIAFVAGGAGIVALGVGSYFALTTLSKNSASHDGCNGNNCDQQGYNDRKDALSAGNVATIAYGIGLAALAGGIVLYVTSPKSAATPGGSGAGRAQWNAGLGPNGLVVKGIF